MLLLAIFNRLKSFRWYFPMFANNWIYWEVELLQHSTQPFSSTFKHYYKIISQGNGKLVVYTQCLKCYVQSKLTALRRMYVGIGPLICINNLPITPVGNVLMRLGCLGKGTRDFSRQRLFFKPGNHHRESHTCVQ